MKDDLDSSEESKDALGFSGMFWLYKSLKIETYFNGFLILWSLLF